MRRAAATFLFLSAATLLAPALSGQRAAPAPSPRRNANTPAPPRRAPALVVILVVDQFRADYVARFSPHWTGGLKRLTAEGASFPQAALPYMATITCVGHAAIATGSLPRTNGIMANDMWDRAAAKPRGCAEDPDTTLVSYGEPVKGAGTSTLELQVPTLADELRAQLPTPPRIVTMSMKDYTATMLAGRRGDAVAWGSITSRTLVTSSAFSKTPTRWVADFVKANPIDADFGRTWTKMLPESAYMFADEAEGERTIGKWTRSFPHVLNGAAARPGDDFYSEWEASPFSDAYLGRLAGAAIDALELGQRAGTDYLAISFSSLDLVGHDYGPRSHEAQDVLARLDRTIGSLLAHLDRAVGRANYVVALTGDHGVSPVPEQMAALGIDGGRILTPELFGRIEQALEPHLGPGKNVARSIYNELFFEPGVYARLQANPEAMRAALAAARSMPGVARVFTHDQLADARAIPADDLERLAFASFSPSHSGDFIVVPQPYHQFASSASRNTGTTHGSPYWYDRRVPLILMGRGIKAGTYTSPASPIDIAPTLAFLCGITLPAADGRVLNEALELRGFGAPGSADSRPSVPTGSDSVTPGK